MDFFDILLAKKLENDKDVSIVQLNVSENGTYSESGKAYSPVVVDVQPPPNSYLKTPIDSYPATAEQLPIPKCDVEIANQKSCKVFVSNKPFVNDKVPYLFRKSAGGDRVYEKLIGGTIAWNQLVQNADTSCTIPILRKYIARIGDTWSIGISDGTAITVDGSIRDMVFDLTQMLGSTIADYIYSLEQSTSGAGVAWFRALFPNDYYAYDSGSLQSVNVASKKVVGFNQWDEEWETGSLNDATGQPIVSTLTIRSKNYIRILPNTTYFIQAPLAGVACFYDSNKTFISSQKISSASTWTTPSNAMWMKFRMAGTYGATYKNDICVNLSWSGTRNGEYEPYVKHSYPLDSTLTLRGIPKADANGQMYYDGDTYESNGTVTRKYGIVDLGTLDYERDTSYDNPFFYAIIDDIGRVSPIKPKINIFCSEKYLVVDSTSMNSFGASADNNTICKEIGAARKKILIRDDSYTDAQAFKTAMSGIYLVYELATPTTESADAYINPQIVDADGTEEFVDYAYSQSTRDVAVPVGHDSLYYNGQLYQTDFAQATTDTINMAELHSIVPPRGEFYMTANGTLSVDAWKK